MTDKKNTTPGNGARKPGLSLDRETRSLLSGASDERAAARARGEGMRTEKHRPRHDEARVPRGHTRAADDWPVRTGGDPNLEEPTGDDRALFNATIEMLGLALATGVSADMRREVRRAYVALAGHAYGEHCTSWLALMLRQRGQSLIATRIRSHRANVRSVEGRITPPTTGEEIATQLAAIARTHELRLGVAVPAWIDDPKLAAAIDAITDVNLGGAGGRGGGKTPEKWAQIIVGNLTKRRAANSRR